MKKRILSLLLALVLALSLLPVSAVAETDVGLDLSKFTFTLVAGTCNLNNFVYKILRLLF